MVIIMVYHIVIVPATLVLILKVTVTAASEDSMNFYGFSKKSIF